MGALVFVCPTSGREVSTGVEIDAESYRDLPKVLAEALFLYPGNSKSHCAFSGLLKA